MDFKKNSKYCLYVGPSYSFLKTKCKETRHPYFLWTIPSLTGHIPGGTPGNASVQYTLAFLNKTTACTQVLTKSSYFFHQVCDVFIILHQLINFYYIIFIITDQLKLDFIFLTTCNYNYYDDIIVENQPVLFRKRTNPFFRKRRITNNSQR